MVKDLHRIALAHQEAVAGIARACDIAVGAAVIEMAKRVGAAAIGDLVEEPLVGLGAIDRAQDLEVRGILDHAARIHRR
jgi:hypothetical protein